ncbi:MAG: AAA family ATPase [Sandaracinaceae bacterium]|nr:AAA family ATPase [Sandaracinaceae bacterium]
MSARSPSGSPPFAPMIGRAEALARVTERLDAGARLVTIVGPPGIGKTRLAAAHLEALRERGAEGAWIDLSTTSGREEVAARVAHEMGLRPSWLDTPDLVDEIGWAIEGHGPVTMILDEAEHCLAELADALGRWLALAPDARAVVTSRERLGIAGEVLVELGPLADDDAAALLAARSGVAHDATVAELAARLDGIPLAIELVAARLHLLEPADVLARLADGLEVIDGARATLRDALAASYERLDAAEQDAFTRIAIFEGGFRIDAAEAVIGDGALLALQALRDKSLLARQASRARLYAPVRAFARERLAPATETDARARHARFFADLVRRALAEPEHARLATLVPELDDLRAARLHAGPADAKRWLGLGVAEVALTRGPPLEALEALEGIDAVDEARGRALEMLGRTDEAAEAYRVAARDADRASGSSRLAHAELARGRLDAAAAAVEEACDAAAPHSATRVEALRIRGVLHHARGQLDAAFAAYDEARVLAEELGLTGQAAQLRADVGTVRLQQRRYEEARACYEGAIEGLDEVASPIARSVTEGNLAILELELGDLDAAAARLGRAYERVRRVGHRLYAAHLGAYVGVVEHERGDRETAVRWYRDALDGLRRVGDKRTIAVVAALLGAAEAGRDRLDAARDAFAEADAALASVDDPGVARAAAVHRAHLELGRGRAGETAVDAARAAATAILEEHADDAALRSSDDLRLALRLLRSALGHGAIHVDAENHRLTLPDGEVVDVGARLVLWRLVEALVAARRETPPRALDAEALLEAGWPGETMTGASGLNRVKVSLSTLRKLGLRAVLVRVEDGYLLDPDVPLDDRA